MILNRLKEYIDYKGISIAAFERSIGMSNASFGKSLKNGGAIGTDKLEYILNIYSDINSEWLLYGKGEMLISKTKAVETPIDAHIYKVLLNEKESKIQELNREIGHLQATIEILEKGNKGYSIAAEPQSEFKKKK